MNDYSLKGQVAFRKAAVFSVEYDTGELYFDRMGQIVRQLAKSGRGWGRDGKIGPQAEIFNPLEELILVVSPSGAALRLSFMGQPRHITDEQAQRVADHAAYAFGVIVDELDVASYQRIEFREVFSFAFPSVEASEEWIRSLGVVRVDESVYRAFGKPYATQWAVLTEGTDCRYRVEVRGTEQSATIPIGGEAQMSVKESRVRHLNKKEHIDLLKANRLRQINPEFSVLLDISAYLWDDMDVDFELSAFAAKRLADNFANFKNSLP